MRNILNKVFLFRTAVSPDDGIGKRAAFWIWNWLLIILSAFGITFIMLMTAFCDYPREIFYGYFSHPLVLLMNFLPVLLIEVLLYFVCSRGWIAFLATGAIITTASIGNYYKLMFRDDPFMFGDISAITTALKISSNYNVAIDKRVLVCIACIILGTVFMALFVRGKMRLPVRFFGVVLMIAAALPLYKLELNNDIYNNRAVNKEHINIWSTTQQYISRGFVYPFIHSVSSSIDKKPDNYSVAEVEQLLSTDSDIPDDKKVNIITIQFEAFSDFTAMGVEGISDDVYAIYHKILDESYHGTLVTNIFAGGTVDTERCFLTGFSDLRNFRKDTNSYAWYLKDQGYYTSGSHPCYQWFYNRLNITEYLGLDDYKFQENHYIELNGGKIIMTDDVFFPDLLNNYRADCEKGQPVLSFNVTYQGHGPYSTEVLKYGDGHWDGDASEGTWYIVNNYLGTIKNTCEYLDDFLNALRKDDAPVVVVMYGDHKPWLGDANSAYSELGVNLDLSTEEGFYNYYSTEYVFWANNTAKEVIGNDFCGNGPTISANYMMNELFDQLGWEGNSYMKYTEDLRKTLPVITTTGYFMYDGKIVKTLPEDAYNKLAQFRRTEYYMRNNFLYN